MGFRVMRPRSRAVVSPSLSACQACGHFVDDHGEEQDGNDEEQIHVGNLGRTERLSTGPSARGACPR